MTIHAPSLRAVAHTIATLASAAILGLLHGLCEDTDPGDLGPADDELGEAL